MMLWWLFSFKLTSMNVSKELTKSCFLSVLPITVIYIRHIHSYFIAMCDTIWLMLFWPAISSFIINHTDMINNNLSSKSLEAYVAFTVPTIAEMIACHYWDKKWTLEWRHNGAMASQIIQPNYSLFKRLFRRRSKKTSKLRVTGLCSGKSPGTGEFPAQMASNAEIVSILWRHHGMGFTRQYTIFIHKTSNILVKNMLVILLSLTELHGAFLIHLGVKHSYILCNCFGISRRKSAPTCFPLINVGGKFGATTGTMRNSWK